MTTQELREEWLEQKLNECQNCEHTWHSRGKRGGLSAKCPVCSSPNVTYWHLEEEKRQEEADRREAEWQAHLAKQEAERLAEMRIREDEMRNKINRQWKALTEKQKMKAIGKHNVGQMINSHILGLPFLLIPALLLPAEVALLVGGAGVWALYSFLMHPSINEPLPYLVDE